MVIQQEIKQLVSILQNRQSGMIVLGGSEVFVRLLPDESTVLITTPVYVGGNYIPIAVREAITKRGLVGVSYIKPTFTVDEDRFEIVLTLQTKVAALDLEAFKGILEEFAWLADEWRQLLDDEDRNDRVHVFH